MPTDKLEPRLLTLIDQEMMRAEDRGMSASAIRQEETFDVTISHHETVLAEEPEQTQDRQEPLADLESRTQQIQQPLVDRIRQITGDEQIKTHTLTNAVTAKLTPAQMEQVAELDEVKIIRLEKLDLVTTMNESVEVIEAREAWEQLNATGRGVRVAVLDSGIDANHPALSGKVVDEVSTAGERPR